MTVYRGRAPLLKRTTGEPDDRPKNLEKHLLLGRRKPVRELQRQLDALLDNANAAEIVANDPVELVRGYRDPADQEVAGLIVACLAYGRVASIRAAAQRALAALGSNPARGIEHPEMLSGFVYRFQSGDDLPSLCRAISSVRKRHGSIAQAILRHHKGEDDYAAALDETVLELRESAFHDSPGLRFLLPRVTDGAAKRLWLYLRWMIRPEDGIDLGTFRHFGTFEPAKLLVPLDTHVQRIARFIGLTDRASGDLKMSREVTSQLRLLRPHDPVAYDVVLCHLGVSGTCPSRRDPVRCQGCPILSLCRLGKRPQGW